MKAKLAAAILLASTSVLLASTSIGSAADLPLKAPYLAPTSVWNWTGFYIGGHVGAGWGTTETTLNSITPAVVAVPAIPLTQNNRSGILGGAQVGYNWQYDWAVFGVQGDIAGLGISGTTPCLVVASCSAKSNWLATVSGRFGGVVGDRTLVYVKGGAAWLQTDHSFSVPTAAFGFGTAFSSSASSTTLGWLLGFGAEYGFTQHWSAFIEYDYMDFARKTVGFDFTPLVGVPAAINVDIKNKLSLAKIGVNYKF